MAVKNSPALRAGIPAGRKGASFTRHVDTPNMTWGVHAPVPPSAGRTHASFSTANGPPIVTVERTLRLRHAAVRTSDRSAIDRKSVV